MADYSELNPYKKAANVLSPPVPKPQIPQKAPVAPKAPDYEPLAVQPDENSEYMGKQLNKISSRINTKGQEAMKSKLLKTSSKSSSKR